MPAFVAALMLLVALALPAGAGAAAPPQPLMKVTQIGGVPAEAAEGNRFAVRVRIRNRGREGGATRLVVGLRREGVTRVLALRFGSTIEPRRGRLIVVLLKIPEALAARTYAVQACVRRRGLSGKNSCRTARRKLRVIAPPSEPSPGARTAGDKLFPEIGNGGYNASRYDIDLRYDPGNNAFVSGTATTMTARATKALSQFSLDFEGLTVSSVAVNGEAAQFERVAPAACSPSPPAVPDEPPCGPTKLVVTPPAPVADDAVFTVRVDYLGTPGEHVDPDGSIEGWIRACTDEEDPETCDGAFVVNQPVGAMTWFPSNNHPADKARFETAVTVPSTHKAIGIGELAPLEPNGDGTTTWTWTEDDPTATYLTTATVGLFDLTTTSMTEDTTSQALPVHMAIDSSCSDAQKTLAGEALGETPDIINFFNDYYGAYPFDSTGAVVDRTTGVGYALEVQTKPHYPTCSSTTGARGTIVHELAHQWFGNAVTLATWSDIWFNEGWAQWSDWFHRAPGPVPTRADAELEFQQNYNSPLSDWSIAPAVLDGDPENLFATFPTYTRGAMTLEGYRQILADANSGNDGKFFEFARELTTRFRYANVTTRQVIDLALEVSDFSGARRARLREYFQQWLYGETKPSITPANF